MSIFTEDYIPVIKENGFVTKKSVSVSQSGKFFIDNGAIVPRYEPVLDNQNQVAAASYAVSHTIFVNDNVSGTYQVAAASAVFGTAGGSGCTVNVEVATGTQAIASGTNQMSSALVLTGTANTVVNGTITTQTVITAGARLNLIFAGTVTGLANFSINVLLQRLS